MAAVKKGMEKFILSQIVICFKKVMVLWLLLGRYVFLFDG